MTIEHEKASTPLLFIKEAASVDLQTTADASHGVTHPGPALPSFCLHTLIVPPEGTSVYYAGLLVTGYEYNEAEESTVVL